MSLGFDTLEGKTAQGVSGYHVCRAPVRVGYYVVFVIHYASMSKIPKESQT